jgi:hypothetical protein
VWVLSTATACSHRGLVLEFTHAVQLVEGWLQDVEGHPAQGGDQQQGQHAQPASSSGQYKSGGMRFGIGAAVQCSAHAQTWQQ